MTRIEKVAKWRGYDSVQDLMVDAAVYCDASATRIARHIGVGERTVRNAVVKFCGGMNELRKKAAEARWLSEMDDNGNHPSCYE